MNQNPGKILVIRLSSIGDILLTTPVFRALRARFPDSEIDVLVKSKFVELLRFNPNISSVMELGAAGSRDLIQLTKQIRSEQYDLVLDLHNSLRSRFIRFCSGAPQIRVVNKRIWKRSLLVNTGKNMYKDKSGVTERYFETLAGYGIPNPGESLEIHFPKELGVEAHRKLAELGVHAHGPVIAIAPAARHKTKMWPADRFQELAVELSWRYHAQIIVLGGKEDRVYCDDIVHAANNRLGPGMVINLAGAFSVLGTAAAIDRCSLMVSNDSGLMHLAAARRKPVVAIFGPTVEEFGFFPYGTKSVVVQQQDLYCRPCSHLGGEQCPKGHFRCMLDTTPANVLDVVATLLPHGTPQTGSHTVQSM